MDINKLTTDQLLAVEGYFTLATMVGKCLQAAVYELKHPDHKPQICVIDLNLRGDAKPKVGIPAEEPAMVDSTLASSGRISSGEVSIEAQIEQLLCLYDPRIRKLAGDLPLYDMFHFASSLFNYDPIDLEGELTPANKRKAAVAWVMTKRAYAIFHMEEALHFLNIPNIIAGDIVYNAPLPSSKISDTDKQFISIACKLCEKIIDDDTPLQDLIDQAIANLEKENKTGQIGKLASIGSMPNGEALGFLYRIVANRGTRIHQRRHETITQDRKGNTVRYTRTNKQTGTSITVTIAQADKYFSKTSKTFKKLLCFTLRKMADQNFPLDVGFSLQELVDLGIYANTSNALRGVKDFFAQQKQTMLSGAVKKGKKLIKEEGGILFYHYQLENGYIKLSVNENFNMEFIANYFTVFPNFAFALSKNAFDLVCYIFMLARQNTKPIKEKGSFSISLDAIRSSLGLPSPEEVKNRRYKQLIMEPIDLAIEEITNALRTVPEAKDCGFTITPVYPDSSNINQWLEGYLEIGLRGDFANTFINIATKAEAEQEKWNRIKTAQLAKLAAKKEAQEANNAEQS